MILLPWTGFLHINRGWICCCFLILLQKVFSPDIPVILSLRFQTKSSYRFWAHNHLLTSTCSKVRVIFVWPWNENVWTKQEQQTNGNRAIWLVYRTNTNARGFWLVKRTLGWKNSMPENFLEINRYFALTSYCNTIGQSNNSFSILWFSLAEKQRVHVWSFYPLADITNNEHLPKLFFKVLRKSL